jgi:hypothetical protein
LNEIVSFCYAIAVSYLKNTIIDGTKNQEFLGINRRDVAFDCIADLFQQGDHGNYIQLEAYFGSFAVEHFSNQNDLYPKMDIGLVHIVLEKMLLLK